MKHLTYLLLILLALSPFTVQAAVKPWYQIQLELEAFNLDHYGNPFGSTGKSDELYDPITKLPSWRIQLNKEALYMELYGNPCGKEGCPKIAYFVPIMQKPTLEPAAIQKPVQAIVAPKVKPLELIIKKEYRNYGGENYAKPYLFVQGIWEGTDHGSLFLVSPSFPQGAYQDQALTSGKIDVVDASSWKTGDVATFTLKVGDRTKEIRYEYTDDGVLQP